MREEHVVSSTWIKLGVTPVTPEVGFIFDIVDNVAANQVTLRDGSHFLQSPKVTKIEILSHIKTKR